LANFQIQLCRETAVLGVRVFKEQIILAI